MSERVTLRSIAQALGVSTTTVTKALNGKAQVSDEMRAKVIETAKKMGYRTNRFAKALVSKERVLYFICNREPCEYIGYLEKGFLAAMDELADFNVKGFIREIKDMNSGYELREALKELADTKVDGVVLTPFSHVEEYIDELRALIEKNVELIYIGTRLDEVPARGCVRLNGVVAGCLAADFLSLTMRENKIAVIFVPSKEIPMYHENINGFMETAAERGLMVGGVFETQDDKEIAYHLTRKVVNDIPNLGGIYVSSYNSVGVCNYLEEANRQDDIIVIGQDIYPELNKKLKNGSLKATLFQNPFNQARTAAVKLYDFISGATSEPCDILIVPQLVLRGNLESYIDNSL